jgi:hypothetical protein
MMNMIVRVVAMIAIATAVACDRSTETLGRTDAPALPSESNTVEESSTSEILPPEQSVTREELPPTASLLPLALAIAVVSLGGALVARCVRRQVQ